MSRKRKLLSITDRCRICLVDNGCTTSLFDEELQPKLNDLSKCTSINIKDEHGLPNIVCYVCLYKLDMWNEFKEQFIRSNQMLMSQLEMIEASDNEGSQSKKLHKDLEQGRNGSLSDSSLEKKPQANSPSSTAVKSTNADNIRDQAMLKDMYISDNDGTSSKDSSQKAPNNKSKNEEKQGSNDPLRLNSTLKAKPLTTSGRRNMMERRMASTKRWVARKKALLAATGESVSDTDSMGSDETELSPVQKARAKTNLDKEVEKQKRLIQTLKNLDATVADKRAILNRELVTVVSESEMRRTRSFKETDTSLNESRSASLNESKQKKIENKGKKEDSPKSEPVKLAKEESEKDDQTIVKQETFIPCLMKSELNIGDDTYIIKSELILKKGHYMNRENSNALLKEIKNGSIEPNSQEKNTDIIDAVQLRRINPIPPDAEKRCVERCLNIEVEGSDLLVLKRSQIHMAGFVENKIKPRLFGGRDDMKEDNLPDTLLQSLDLQLETIVEKAITNKVESSIRKNYGIDLKSLVHQSGTVSPDFVKAAANSAKYQPRIVLKRLNIAKESEKFNINNIHAAFKRTVKSKLGGPFSMVSHKRQSVLPIRYNDYNTSALDSDSYLSDESDTSRSENNRQTISEDRMPAKQEEELKTDVSEIKNEPKVEPQENVFKLTLSSGEKHGCGVCDQAFDSRVEAIAHVRVHKTEGGLRSNKRKVMRCMRCHEIVEARFVKAHVCKSARQQIHKCFVCKCTFRTEKLLAQHLGTHDQPEFSIHNVTKGEPQKSKAFKSDQLPKDNSRLEAAEPQSEKTKVKEVRGVEKPKETYTCFVCDKIFTDEEILKDHLQKHCDDMSEDDQSPGKEQYECAICGDSLESEDALEAHVEKHLFDEEDDNPNLINISNESSKSRGEVYPCLQCTETFNSEMLLEMHMQAHEEEAAIAEWEKQGIKAYEFQCLICDDLFETEDDLSEHLDIHNANAHVCQLCDKPFTTLEDLQKHVATH